MDALDRLYRKLLDVRPRTRPDGDGDALTIADVYQQLVPYRLVRGELGFSELKEYEHALLRLFAGERGYLRVAVAKIADEFRRELRSPNPILGIYRDYATTEVKVVDAPATAPPVAAPAPEPEADRPRGDRPAPPAPGPWAETTAEMPDAAPPVFAEEPSPRAQEASTPSPPEPADGAPASPLCWSCSGPLPADVAARFCPHCGGTQLSVPCGECAAPLRPAWKFCVQCGARRPGSAASRTGPGSGGA